MKPLMLANAEFKLIRQCLGPKWKHSLENNCQRRRNSFERTVFEGNDDCWNQLRRYSSSSTLARNNFHHRINQFTESKWNIYRTGTVLNHRSLTISTANCQSGSKSPSPSSQCSAPVYSNEITGHDVEITDHDNNPIKIHYEKSGHGEQIILLMPGALGTGKSDFLPQLTQLNGDEFTMIAWDPPGYGQSYPPEREFQDFYRRDAEMAAKFMMKLNYPRYSVLGWSDGGISGLILSSLKPGSISRLIVWGSNAYVSEEDRHLLIKVRNPRNDWSDAYRKVFTDIYGEERFYRLWDRWVAYYLTLDDICKTELPKIECPVLILHGDRDPMIAPEHPVYLVNHIPNATLFRFEKGKHNIHQRFAQEFNRLVEDFITTAN